MGSRDANSDLVQGSSWGPAGQRCRREGRASEGVSGFCFVHQSLFLRLGPDYVSPRRELASSRVPRVSGSRYCSSSGSVLPSILVISSSVYAIIQWDSLLALAGVCVPLSGVYDPTLRLFEVKKTRQD